MTCDDCKADEVIVCLDGRWWICWKCYCKRMRGMAERKQNSMTENQELIARAKRWEESDLRSFPSATLELIDRLVAALEEAEATLPDTIKEALNSGDGVYRP